MKPWNLRRIRNFHRDERGYVLILGLIMLPLLLGFSLLVIDLSRVDNLQTDLQDSVDSLALVAARQLDGGPDAIARAEEAMKNLVKNGTNFPQGGPIVVDYPADVVAKFFDQLPASADDSMFTLTPLDPSDSDSDAKAKYVWVYSKAAAGTLTTIFPLPSSASTDTVVTAAQAVATYDVSACDVTPVFICNPYENQTKTLAQAFTDGDLYGRQFDMTLSGNSTAAPGNFGWLQLYDSGGDALQDALATSAPGECYNTSNLDVKTGGTIGKAKSGLNVRFDLYSADLAGSASSNAAYKPDRNIRKGASNPSSCSAYTPESDGTSAMALPAGETVTTLGGGQIHSSISDYTGVETEYNYQELLLYFYINHPAVVCPTYDPTAPKPAISTCDFPTGLLWEGTSDSRNNNPDTKSEILGPLSNPQFPGQVLVDQHRMLPSAYDIYQWEIANGAVLDKAPNNDMGEPQCYNKDLAGEDPKEGRRTIFAAVVNCDAINAPDSGVNFAGSSTPIPQGFVEAFVSFFLTRPMITDGSYKTITGEITGVTGSTASSNLDTFLREESYLVR